MIYERDHHCNFSSNSEKKLNKMEVFVSVTARISRKISSSGEQKPDLGKTNH